MVSDKFENAIIFYLFIILQQYIFLNISFYFLIILFTFWFIFSKLNKKNNLNLPKFYIGNYSDLWQNKNGYFQTI